MVGITRSKVIFFFVWSVVCLGLGGVLWQMLVRFIAACVMMSKMTPERNSTKTQPFCVSFFPLQEGIFEGLPQVKGTSNLIQSENSRGSGRCLTRWSRTCNIPTRPRDFPADLVYIWLRHSSNLFVLKMLEQEMEKSWKETHAPCLLGLGMSLTLITSMSWKGSNVAGIGKGLRHQEGPTSEKPNAETSWDMLMEEIPFPTTCYLWNPMKNEMNMIFSISTGDHRIPSRILGSRFFWIFVWGDPQRGGTARGSSKVWSAEHHALWTSSDPPVLLEFVGMAPQEQSQVAGSGRCTSV